MAWFYAGVGTISAATLILQITLTRIFSVAQWYHFAFLSISVTLLGYGASGAFLALRRYDPDEDEVRRLPLISLGFCISTVAAYLAVNYLPFDSYRISLERRQSLYLIVHYLALVVPFFFSGLVISIALRRARQHTGRLYATNLAGSSVGCLVVIGSLATFGAEGTVAMVGALGAISSGLFLLSRTITGACLSRVEWIIAGASMTAALALIILGAYPPQWWEINMSPYKTLSAALRFPHARILHRQWNANSRVDVIGSEGIHAAPGLSLTYRGSIPPQLGLTVDGSNLNPITRHTSSEDEDFLAYLPTALAYRLRPSSRVLVISPAGGLDVLAALHHGAESVVAVEGNPAIVTLIRQEFGAYSGNIYQDDRVRVVTEDGRSYTRRTSEHYDIIHLSLTDSYHPIISGAYGLSENYLLTIEAFVDYLEHLSPTGVLMITRWLQDPPSEELRAWALAIEALGRLGVGAPADHLVAIRSWSTATILVGRAPFAASDLALVKEFCERLNFDLVYYSTMTIDEANRFNVLEKPTYYETFTSLAESDDRLSFYDGYDYEISPPTDDQPFFFHFFKWRQVPDILQSLGRTWQPFGGSGYLVLVVLLLLAVLASGLLIILPLVRGKATRASLGARPILYFLLLGLGYMCLEIPLMQRFILFLGQPTYAFAIVLFALLVTSGMGSALSPRVERRVALPALVITALVYLLLLPRLLDYALGWPFPWRVAATVLGLAPLGILMGMPFPVGIATFSRSSPGIIPWLWGVNGCASVISSILATMLSVSFGFSVVFLIACGAYATALFVILPHWSTARADGCARQ